MRLAFVGAAGLENLEKTDLARAIPPVAGGLEQDLLVFLTGSV